MMSSSRPMRLEIQSTNEYREQQRRHRREVLLLPSASQQRAKCNIPQPLSFEEFKELRRAQKQKKHQYPSNSKDSWQPPMDRHGVDEQEVVIKEDDEFTSMIHSLQIDVLDSSRKRNQNNRQNHPRHSRRSGSKDMKTAEVPRVATVTEEERIEERRFNSRDDLDCDDMEENTNEHETRDDATIKEVHANRTIFQDHSSKAVAMNEEEDPVQCAFEVFRSDARAIQALQDVFVTTPITTITQTADAIPTIVNGVPTLDITLQEDVDVHPIIETIPVKTNEDDVQNGKKLLPTVQDRNDDDACDNIEDKEKEMERLQRQLRQTEDLSGMLLVIPENWEEQAGFVTSKSSLISPIEVTNAKPILQSSNGHELLLTNSEGCDGSSTIPTTKQKNVIVVVESPLTLPSIMKNGHPVTTNDNHHHEGTPLTLTRKKGRTSTNALPPLRLSLGGGGSMKKLITSTARKMRRSMSSSGGDSISFSSKEQTKDAHIMDDAVKTDNRVPLSYSSATEKTVNKPKDNISVTATQSLQPQCLTHKHGSTENELLPLVSNADICNCDDNPSITVQQGISNNFEGIRSSNEMHILAKDTLLPGVGDDVVLSPMERDWNNDDRRPDIFRCPRPPESEKDDKLSSAPSTTIAVVIPCVDKEISYIHSPNQEEGTTTTTQNKPEESIISDDKTKGTSATSSTTNHNSEEMTSNPSCEMESTSMSHPPRVGHNNNNCADGIVKSRISQIQQRIEILSSSCSLSISDDRISPISASSIADGRRKDNNCLIRTVPIGIAKSNSRQNSSAAPSLEDGGPDVVRQIGSLTYTYSC